MTMNKLFLAASLGLVLAACAGEQAETAAVEAPAAIEAPAAGEIPQAGAEGIVTGSPEENVIGTDANVGATTADAGALGEPVVDPNAPTVADPMTTEPVLEGNAEVDAEAELPVE
ncbi:hypothetical protein [Cognatilysobacter bugurensis]|nr:hypothetical protein [Lysobacter bugurensis]